MKAWGTKPLSEICTFANGLWTGKKGPLTKAGVFRNTNFRTDGVLDDTDVAYLEVEQRQLDKRRLEIGDIIIEKSGGGPKQAVGRVAYFDKAGGPFSFSNFTSSARVIDPREVDARYLLKFLDWCYLSGVTEGMQSHSTGIRNLDFGAYKALEIPLPPLEEQRRIVAVLDEAFAAIAAATANAEKNLANARELLHAATESRMKAQGDGWVEKSLGSFCDIYQSETISRKQMSDDGPYVVFGANGKIGRYGRFNHEQPQLLVTCRGATCGAINMSEPFCWITGNAMVVRPKDGELRLGFLRRIFETGFDFSKVITGAAQPQITRQSLAPSKVAFPIDLKEQERLELKLDEIEVQVRELESLCEARIMELAELKQSLLHRAFSGELTEREPLAA